MLIHGRNNQFNGGMEFAGSLPLPTENATLQCNTHIFSFLFHEGTWSVLALLLRDSDASLGRREPLPY